MGSLLLLLILTSSVYANSPTDIEKELKTIKTQLDETKEKLEIIQKQLEKLLSCNVVVKNKGSNDND